MTHSVTPAELRKMQLPELKRETDRKRLDVAKMRMEVQMRSLKDTAKYRRERKELALMLTIQGELERGTAKAPRSLKFVRTASTVSASAQATADKSASVSADKPPIEKTAPSRKKKGRADSNSTSSR